MFFLLYRHTNDGVFDDLPKISKDFQNCSEGHTNVPEDFSRFSKIPEDFQGSPEDISIIHQRI